MRVFGNKSVVSLWTFRAIGKMETMRSVHHAVFLRAAKRVCRYVLREALRSVHIMRRTCSRAGAFMILRYGNIGVGSSLPPTEEGVNKL